MEPRPPGRSSAWRRPLIQEAGPQARPVEDKRGELAALPEQRLGAEEVAAIAAIGDNRGSMALKGASPEHEGAERPDRWPLEPSWSRPDGATASTRTATCAASRRPVPLA